MDLFYEFFRYDNRVHRFFEGKPSPLNQYDSILSLLIIVNTVTFVTVDISNGVSRNNSASLALLAISILIQVMRGFVPVSIIPFRESCQDRIVAYLPYSSLTDQAMLVSIVCLGVQFGDPWLVLAFILGLPTIAHNQTLANRSDYSYLNPQGWPFHLSIFTLAVSRMVKYFLVVNSNITLKYYGQAFSFEGRMLYLVFLLMDGLLAAWAPKLWHYHSMVEMCHSVCPHGCKPFNKISYTDFIMEHARPSTAEFKRVQTDLLMAPTADKMAQKGLDESTSENENSLPLMNKGGGHKGDAGNMV